ncbi:hypothetical protein BDB00DRAFT_821205, partial [Zychaea mexicana]|uniref:uncharacterized protein n=1 Tax=Zychaea mexicana TaxID=64656 RepID=UPI0022FE8CBD
TTAASIPHINLFFCTSSPSLHPFNVLLFVFVSMSFAYSLYRSSQSFISFPPIKHC